MFTRCTTIGNLWWAMRKDKDKEKSKSKLKSKSQNKKE